MNSEARLYAPASPPERISRVSTAPAAGRGRTPGLRWGYSRYGLLSFLLLLTACTIRPLMPPHADQPGALSRAECRLLNGTIVGEECWVSHSRW